MKNKRIPILAILPLFLSSCDSPFDRIKPYLEANTQWTSDDGNIIFYAKENRDSGTGKLFFNDKYQTFLWGYSSSKRGFSIMMDEDSFQTSFSLSRIKKSLFGYESNSLKITADSPYVNVSFQGWSSTLRKDKLN